MFRISQNVPYLLALLTIFLMPLGYSPAWGQIAVNTLDSDKAEVRAVVEFEGHLWVGTEIGNYRIDDDGVHRIPDVEARVLLMKVVGEYLWINTSLGLYKIRGSQAERIKNVDFWVRDLVATEEALWLTSYQGVFKYVKGMPRLILSSDLYGAPERIVKGEGKDVWAIMPRGILVTDGASTHKVRDIGRVRKVQLVKNETWFFTSEGIQRVHGRDVKALVLDSDPSTPLLVHEMDNTVWLLTTRHDKTKLYRLRDSEVSLTASFEGNVNTVVEADGKLWFGTSQGLYWIDHGELQQILDLKLPVWSIQGSGGMVWVAAADGVYKIESNGNYHARKIVSGNLQDAKIGAIDKAFWITTNHGVYRIDMEENKGAVRIPDVNSEVHAFRVTGQHKWVVLSEGIYRIDEGVSLSVDLQPKPWWGNIIQKMIGRQPVHGGIVRVRTEYLREGKIPLQLPRSPSFKAALETESREFEKAIEKGNYRSEREVGAGFITIFVWVHDEWHNTFKGNIPVFVIPGQIVFAAVIPILWLCGLVLIIAFSPVMDACHDILMNESLRKYGSLGLVPIVITMVPLVRHHVFRRYRRGIRSDEELSHLIDHYVVPDDRFLSEAFAELLASQRVLLLKGLPGVGKTAYLKYLTILSVETNRASSLLGSSTPIFLPLAQYQALEPEAVVAAQLGKYGLPIDIELTRSLLQKGGFMILVDGLNEVDENVRKKINTFIYRHSRANVFCVSSQVVFSEFAWIKAVEVPTLDRDKVRNLLYTLLERQKAEGMLKTLTEADYDLYKIPQDLIFAVTLVSNGRSLPRSRRELYDAVLSPIFELWQRSGHGEYLGALLRHAFEMLVSQTIFFDHTNTALPVEVRDQLVQMKFLVPRGGRYVFQHELVRAYLASKHFTPRWRVFLNDSNLSVDQSWLSMLEFAILEIGNNDEARELMFCILGKTPKLAGDLFKRLDSSKPEVCSNWRNDFIQRYGEILLDVKVARADLS